MTVQSHFPSPSGRPRHRDNNTSMCLNTETLILYCRQRYCTVVLQEHKKYTLKEPNVYLTQNIQAKNELIQLLDNAKQSE